MSDTQMNTGLATVTAALQSLAVDAAFLTKLSEKNIRAEWDSFGKMNSHVYRRILQTLFSASKMTKEAQFMVHFLFSVVKNVNRVLNAMDSLPQEMRDADWHKEVKNFLQANVVQYVSDVKQTKKFPAVNIPHCNPAIDALGYVIQKEVTDLEEFYERTTSVQFKLSPVAQEAAKRGYMRYWSRIVTSTKNPESAAFASMTDEKKQEFYENPAADKYFLIAKNFEEILPLDVEAGYSEEELAVYLLTEGETEFLTAGNKLPDIEAVSAPLLRKFTAASKKVQLNKFLADFRLPVVE